MYEDHEDKVVNRNKIWSGTRAPGNAQGQRSALVHYNYVKYFILCLHMTFMYACTGLVLIVTVHGKNQPSLHKN